MSLPDRRFVLVAPLALVACGFEPVYGPGGSGSALQGKVQVVAPTTRDAYVLVRHLEEKLGRGSAPNYALSLTLQTRQEGLGIDSGSNTNRYNVIGVAGYVLTDNRTGQAVTSGSVNSFTGYSTTGSTVSSLAAERDANERLMIILADQIIARLLTADIG